MTTTCLRPIRAALARDARLEGIGRALRLAGIYVAVPARARARVAENLERRGSASRALGDVRTARLLADRVQPVAVDELLDLDIAGVRARRADLHPLGAAGALGDRQRPVHPWQSRDGDPGSGARDQRRPRPRRARMVRGQRPRGALERHGPVRLLLQLRGEEAVPPTRLQPERARAWAGHRGVPPRGRAGGVSGPRRRVCAVVEGEELPLGAWDFLHCPPGVGHAILGAGEGPSVVSPSDGEDCRKGIEYLAGGRVPPRSGSRARVRYGDGWLPSSSPKTSR